MTNVPVNLLSPGEGATVGVSGLGVSGSGVIGGESLFLPNDQALAREGRRRA